MLLQVKKLLEQRGTAGAANYKLISVLLTIVGGFYWFYVLFTRSPYDPELNSEQYPLIIDCLMFALVFDLILLLSRVRHHSLLKLNHFILFPMSYFKKIIYLLTFISVDVKSGIFAVSLFSLLIYFSLHSLFIPIIITVILFGIAHIALCMWEVVLVLIFERLSLIHQRRISQEVMGILNVSLIYGVLFVPKSILRRVPFASTIYRAIIAVFQGNFGKAFLQEILLAFYVIPAMLFIFLLITGGLPIMRCNKYSIFLHTRQPAVAPLSMQEKQHIYSLCKYPGITRNGSNGYEFPRNYPDQ